MPETAIRKTWRLMAENTARDRARAAKQKPHAESAREFIPATLATKYQLLNERIHRQAKMAVDTRHDLGIALLEMSESGLYREKFETWEAYLESVSDISLRHANLLVNAEKVRKVLQINGIFGTTVPILTERAAREIAKEPTPEGQVEIVQGIIANNQPVTSATVSKVREKRAKASVIDAATGKPEQQEFSFTFKTTPEHREDAMWFLSLSATERAAIIATARNQTK